MIISEIYNTSKFGLVEIIGYKNSRSVTVKFLNTGTVDTFPAGNIRKGAVRDRFAPSVCGVGYLGDGKSGGRATKKSYTTWLNMIKRCYSNSKLMPSYSGCSVCEEWHNYGVFEVWYDKEYIEGFDLDKDIKISGNKVYSPVACSFVSHKENMIKAVAKSYKFKSPCGIIVDIYNLDDFCRQNKLNAPHMSAVSSGKLKAHKGWAKAV
jgi:hypothetical protein